MSASAATARCPTYSRIAHADFPIGELAFRILSHDVRGPALICAVPAFRNNPFDVVLTCSPKEVHATGRNVLKQPHVGIQRPGALRALRAFRDRRCTDGELVG
jgi:hypothetical protein